MDNDGRRALEELVAYLKGDARLASETWSSLSYWARGAGVALRQYKYYSEQLRLSGKTVDFHLYIKLNDGLVVFNALQRELPQLELRLREKYPSLSTEYKSEPACDASTNKMKNSMAMAHFYVPAQDREMLRDVFYEIYEIAKRLVKGNEVRVRGSRTKDILDEDGGDCDAHECAEEEVLSSAFGIAPMENVSQRPYDSDVVKISDLDDDALSWVMTIGELFDREPVSLKSGRKFSFGDLIIPSYQRKYTWQKKNIRRLCRDLLGAFEEGRNTYHLGTVIFCRHGDDLEVVDGQQRLTTIGRMIGRSIFRIEERCDTDRQFSPEDEKRIVEVLGEYGMDERNKIIDILNSSTIVCIAVKKISESFQLFSTQNGRGRPLSPENLLKAFHLHEYGRTDWGDKLHRNEPDNINPACSDGCKMSEMDYDTQWESFSAQRTLREGRLLSQVFGEHLYRIRRWCRGEFPEEVFGNSKIDEFKGLTVRVGESDRPPLQNLAVLRHLYRGCAAVTDDNVFSARSRQDGMDKFVSIDQPIVNGEDFFRYAFAYANAYLTLYENPVDANRDPELAEFRVFYEKACINYAKSGRRGDCYARHIFESLCLFCYDKFGVRGLLDCKEDLYRCAYFERATRSRCYYSTCGASFARQATHKMLGSATVAEIVGELHDLGVLSSDEAGKHDMMSDGDIPTGLQVVRGIVFRKEVK